MKMTYDLFIYIFSGLVRLWVKVNGNCWSVSNVDKVYFNIVFTGFLSEFKEIKKKSVA